MDKQNVNPGQAGVGHSHGNGQVMESITVVVNGTPTEVKYNLNEPLGSIIGRALEQTDTAHQSLEDWYIKDGGGKSLDLKEKIGDFHFPSDVKLFLNKRAGPLG